MMVVRAADLGIEELEWLCLDWAEVLDDLDLDLLEQEGADA